MKKFIVLVLLAGAAACSQRLAEESVRYGDIHNQGLAYITSELAMQSGFADDSLVSHYVNQFFERSGYSLSTTSEAVPELSDTSRSLYRQMNAIMLHPSSATATVDTLVDLIINWKDGVEVNTGISMQERAFLIEIGDIATSSLHYWDSAYVSFVNPFYVDPNLADEKTERTIRGLVVDEYGEPMIGVHVRVQGSNSGAVTDYSGNFLLSAPTGNVIIKLSFIGYKDLFIRVGSADNIGTIVMSEDYDVLDPSTFYPSTYDHLLNIAVLGASDAVEYLLTKNIGAAIINSLLAASRQ